MISKEIPHAEEVHPGAGPRHADESDDARAALAIPRLSDHPQGGGPEGRQGLGRHHRPREREDGSPGPYLLSEVPTLCNGADSMHSVVQPLLLVQYFQLINHNLLKLCLDFHSLSL